LYNSLEFLKSDGSPAKPKDDYPIFMAVSKKFGKDNSGEYVYKKDEKGNFILDGKGWKRSENFRPRSRRNRRGVRQIR